MDSYTHDLLGLIGYVILSASNIADKNREYQESHQNVYTGHGVMHVYISSM